MIALFNISYTKESSVLTKGEMSFTLYVNRNMANTGLFTVISSRARLYILALCLACQTFEPEDQGRFQGGHLKQNVFFFFFFYPLVMQNYLVQERWNYINDKNYTP